MSKRTRDYRELDKGKTSSALVSLSVILLEIDGARGGRNGDTDFSFTLFFWIMTHIYASERRFLNYVYYYMGPIQHALAQKI